jgi:carbamate kinase
MCAADEAEALAAENGWAFKPDGGHILRVVPSPKPQRILGIEPVRWLLGRCSVVICAGGGGMPTIYTDDTAPAGRRLIGVGAVIDRDLARAVRATDLRADALLMITAVGAVAPTGLPRTRTRAATRADLGSIQFAGGSMGAKVNAASLFIEQGAEFAAIGSIHDAPALVDGTAGTSGTAHPDRPRRGHRGG